MIYNTIAKIISGKFYIGSGYIARSFIKFIFPLFSARAMSAIREIELRVNGFHYHASRLEGIIKHGTDLTVFMDNPHVLMSPVSVSYGITNEGFALKAYVRRDDMPIDLLVRIGYRLVDKNSRYRRAILFAISNDISKERARQEAEKLGNNIGLITNGRALLTETGWIVLSEEAAEEEAYREIEREIKQFQQTIENLRHV